MEILLILFLVFIVWPLVKVLFAVGKARRVIRDQFRQQQARYGNTQAQASAQQSKSKKKIFSRSDGEYVEYEDIVEQSSEQKPEKGEYTTNVSQEPQVEDAEWEDIK